MSGHISPSLPILSLILSPSVIELLLLMACFADFLDVGMSERRIQHVLWMVSSDWSPLNSEGLMSYVCLGFEIPRVEYSMAVQVVVLMVP